MRRRLLRLILPGEARFFILRAIDHRITTLRKEKEVGKAVRTVDDDIDFYQQIMKLFAPVRWRGTSRNA